MLPLVARPAHRGRPRYRSRNRPLRNPPRTPARRQNCRPRQTRRPGAGTRIPPHHHRRHASRPRSSGQRPGSRGSPPLPTPASMRMSSSRRRPTRSQCPTASSPPRMSDTSRASPPPTSGQTSSRPPRPRPQINQSLNPPPRSETALPKRVHRYPIRPGGGKIHNLQTNPVFGRVFRTRPRFPDPVFRRSDRPRSPPF